MVLSLILTANCVGCGTKTSLKEPYDPVLSSEQYGIGRSDTTAGGKTGFFAEQLCVGGNEDLLSDSVNADLSKAAGLFNVSDHEILYARNIHERLYPASTTKVLTAYLALKYGDLSALTTVSAGALVLEEGSTLCGLHEGDILSLEQLLYGLLMCSGNDAANVIAETISGSQEAFASLMNEECRKLGATNSHFVNAHGLHNEDHYTTAYDLYLIFKAALSYDKFREIISCQSYTSTYTDRNGDAVMNIYGTTNKYLRGERTSPAHVTVIGGKTGTTFMAGYCLVLLSTNSLGEDFISIVLKGSSRDNLYDEMTQLLELVPS